jgi:hypothetical protein
MVFPCESVVIVPPTTAGVSVQLKLEEDCPDTVTTTAEVPATAPEGTLAVMDVAVTAVVTADVPPNVTDVDPATKLVPVTLNVPPTVPEQALTVGTGVPVVTESALPAVEPTPDTVAITE